MVKASGAKAQQRVRDAGVAGGPGAARKTRKRPRRKPRQLPPYKLLLHNDDVNEMTYVVQVIRKLTPLSLPEAVQKMLEAHHTGVAVLLVTHKERAELYVEQFASCGLTATAEPDR
ncbi:MAG: ATP-dependent Clp protease adaptor ClpS [Phycisphaerae bacterium]